MKVGGLRGARSGRRPGRGNPGGRCGRMVWAREVRAREVRAREVRAREVRTRSGRSPCARLGIWCGRRGRRQFRSSDRPVNHHRVDPLGSQLLHQRGHNAHHARLAQPAGRSPRVLPSWLKMPWFKTGWMRGVQMLGMGALLAKQMQRRFLQHRCHGQSPPGQSLVEGAPNGLHIAPAGPFPQHLGRRGQVDPQNPIRLPATFVLTQDNAIEKAFQTQLAQQAGGGFAPPLPIQGFQGTAHGP